jgi:hypothetical protein
MEQGKKTAVEWLVNQIAGKPTHYIIGTDDLEEIKENRYNLLFNLDIDITPLVEHAKQMEKEQIKEAYIDGCVGEMYELSATYTAEQYYNKTYANDTTKGLPEEDSKRRAWHY